MSGEENKQETQSKAGRKLKVLTPEEITTSQGTYKAYHYKKSCCPSGDDEWIDHFGDRKEYSGKMEMYAFALVMVIMLSVPVLSYALKDPLMPKSADDTIVLTGHAPDGGGWSPNRIVAHQNETITIKVVSADTVHGFAIEALDFDTGAVLLGEPKTFELTIDLEPGEYPFICSIYCASNHDDMVGVLVVEPPVQDSH